MERVWFITWRTHGTWLPGDQRGFVGPIIDTNGERVIHNQPGTPKDADLPALEAYSRAIMKGEPVSLEPEHAPVVVEQLLETAEHRGWRLHAIAVLCSPIHLVVDVHDHRDPSNVLRDFKSYASRALDRRWPRPPSGTWWTESGSIRVVKAEENLKEVVEYVLDQQFSLRVWAGAEVAAILSR